MRWRNYFFRWRPLLLILIGIYTILILSTYFSTNLEKNKSSWVNPKFWVRNNKLAVDHSEELEKIKPELEDNVDSKNVKGSLNLHNQSAAQLAHIEKDEINKEKFAYKLNYRGQSLMIEEVLTHPDMPKLKERVTIAENLIKAKRTKILMWDAGFNQENLGGCPDWNCEVITGTNNLDKADVVIIQSPSFSIKKEPNQLFVYYSQESPRNSPSLGSGPVGYFNAMFGFRHDTVGGSPYGYTVKLAPESRRVDEIIDKKLVMGKSKGAAWYVSHCNTQSRRESYVKELQKYVQVDIYGQCGNMKCNKGDKCEKSVDNDYHFYMALENSICKDYITEKLWNQGYSHTVIPIVLKRSIIEDYVPPKSFIAFDDFETVQDLAAHMKYLMENKTAYMSYFDWRRDYEVVYLNGLAHDALERPWGFCQLCRLSHLAGASNKYAIQNLGKFWDESCDADGKLVSEILAKSSAKEKIDNNTVVNAS